MARALLVGYFGMSNVGDDALLACAAWGARRLLGGGTLRVTASSLPVLPGMESIAAAYPRVQRVRGEFRIRRLVEAWRADSVVFGGGSNFHSSRDINAFRHLVAVSGRGPHIAAGVSLGPFKTSGAERACGRLLRQLDFVGLRDGESFEIARALAPSARAEKTFDLGVLLTRATPDRAPPARDAHAVGFALCDYERFVGGDPRKDSRRRERLRRVVAELDPDIVRRVVFLDFNGHPEYGDRSVHMEVARAVPSGIEVQHIPYAPDPAACLERVRGLGAIVAVRLHAAVFAYVAGTPCIMLAYHPKSYGWASQIGMNPAFVHESADFDPSTVARQVHRALTGGLEPPELALSVAQERALANFPLTL